jgi:hypothetical protein
MKTPITGEPLSGHIHHLLVDRNKLVSQKIAEYPNIHMMIRDRILGYSIFRKMWDFVAEVKIKNLYCSNDGQHLFFVE